VVASNEIERGKGMTRNDKPEETAEWKSTLWSGQSNAAGHSEGVERFVSAQEDVWDVVLSELRAGEKRGHWMWYIFPQIIGLGCSYMATRYAIQDMAEAREYLSHPVLGMRLCEAMSTVLIHRGRKTARDIFSGIDALKLRSSATLFNVVSPEDVFKEVLDGFYSGKPCEKTLTILGLSRSVDAV
jgi:uncharacterized protein (DUF1810 family)